MGSLSCIICEHHVNMASQAPPGIHSTTEVLLCLSSPPPTVLFITTTEAQTQVCSHHLPSPAHSLSWWSCAHTEWCNRVGVVKNCVNSNRFLVIPHNTGLGPEHTIMHSATHLTMSVGNPWNSMAWVQDFCMIWDSVFKVHVKFDALIET